MPRYSERERLLEAARVYKMARSAHAYVRGNTDRFYEWLAGSAVAKRIPVGPAVWICGDCHLGNLGPLSDGGGGVEVQIRDHDQAVIGNPAFDLIRLALSLASANRGSDLPGVITAEMIGEIIEGYESAMNDPSADIEAAGAEPGVVKTVRRKALGRKWNDLARASGSRTRIQKSRAGRNSGISNPLRLAICPKRSNGRKSPRPSFRFRATTSKPGWLTRPTG
ncbi:DUF2252 family protein [Chenggangzhangella methanolivorans]|uniref:DUF2252 family protein n=1 Tax=Chenggangzhangella methanolivorans TaxID=1437009 RepID=UPI0032047374